MISKGCLVRYDYNWSVAHGEVYLVISDPYRAGGETWVDILYEGKKVSLYQNRLELISQ